MLSGPRKARLIQRRIHRDKGPDHTASLYLLEIWKYRQTSPLEIKPSPQYGHSKQGPLARASIDAFRSTNREDAAADLLRDIMYRSAPNPRHRGVVPSADHKKVSTKSSDVLSD